MQNILKQAEKIKLLICDVDGVFSDGSIYLGNHGEELKAFHTLDGLGIKLLLKTGVEVAVITARESHIVQHRMESLGIRHIYQGNSEKIPAFEEIINKLHITPEQAAYLGDDLPDLPLMKRAGLGIAVANANYFVRQHADWVTKTNGGHGAVREVCELIMRAQKTLAAAQEFYLYS